MTKLILCLTMMLVSLHVLGADCHQALFGWDALDDLGRSFHHNGVFGNEGGYQNLSSDSGNFINGVNCGGTKFGITCRNYPHLNIRNLTKEQAAQIYHDDQWQAIHGDEIKSQYMAYKLLDLAINTGETTAVNLMIETVNDLTGSSPGFNPEGKVTPEMVTWLNDFTSQSERRWWFFDHLRLVAMKHYIAIVDQHPIDKRFLMTWARRDIQE